jgi:hypothetical protein
MNDRPKMLWHRSPNYPTPVWNQNAPDLSPVTTTKIPRFSPSDSETLNLELLELLNPSPIGSQLR